MRAVWGGGGVKEVGKICAQSLLRGCLGKHEKKFLPKINQKESLHRNHSPRYTMGCPLTQSEVLETQVGFFLGGG